MRDRNDIVAIWEPYISLVLIEDVRGLPPAFSPSDSEKK